MLSHQVRGLTPISTFLLLALVSPTLLLLALCTEVWRVSDIKIANADTFESQSQPAPRLEAPCPLAIPSAPNSLRVVHRPSPLFYAGMPSALAMSWPLPPQHALQPTLVQSGIHLPAESLCWHTLLGLVHVEND